jgi:hypothetical protein
VSQANTKGLMAQSLSSKSVFLTSITSTDDDKIISLDDVSGVWQAGWASAPPSKRLHTQDLLKAEMFYCKEDGQRTAMLIMSIRTQHRHAVDPCWLGSRPHDPPPRLGGSGSGWDWDWEETPRQLSSLRQSGPRCIGRVARWLRITDYCQLI